MREDWNKERQEHTALTVGTVDASVSWSRPLCLFKEAASCAGPLPASLQTGAAQATLTSWTIQLVRTQTWKGLIDPS